MSLTPDITEALPSLLSARKVSSEGEARGVLYDVVLSGVGFTFAIDSQNPYLRETVAVQKQQIDTSAEAGEQTLEGNWVRSQTSWHLGAGADYYEPGSRDGETLTRYRFKDSRGVNVWDKGSLSLLPAMGEVETSPAGLSVCGARVPSLGDVWYSRVGADVYRHDSTGTTLQFSDSFSSGRMVVAGSKLLIGGTFGVRQVDLLGTTPASLTTQGLGSIVNPYWVKSRVISVRGNALHQHSLAGGAVDAASLLWTHPDSGWTWSGVTETPDAILAAGYSGGTSTVYAFTLADDSGGTVPKLSQPHAVAEFPPGEEVRSIQSYLGTYLGIGTTAGVRVGLIGQNGQIQYGPLLVETPDPVVSLAARDSFIYAATGSSVIRVNLADRIDDNLRFPYAYDVEIPAGETIGRIAFYGTSDRLVCTSTGVGTYEASATQKVASGWLESGDIRYGTTIPKAFRSVDLMATTDADSSVAVSVVSAGVTSDLVTLSDGRSGQGIGISGTSGNEVQLSYLLTLGSTGTASPVVEAVSVKAVPAPHRQRLVQFPLHVADWMRDSKNVAFGRDGYATTLLATLEALEQDRAVVSVTDRTRPETFEATVEKVEFARVEPRARNGKPNFGGIAKITLRTL